MRHTNHLLKPLTIDNAKPRDKAYALTDGGGLLLEVLPSGTKTWRFKYHLNGKREKVTIGADKITGADKCGGTSPPAAKLENMTINGKASNL